MSRKSGRDAAKAVPRAYCRLAGREQDTVQRMPERRASCRATREGPRGSPSTAGAEVSSHGLICLC